MIFSTGNNFNRDHLYSDDFKKNFFEEFSRILIGS